MARGRSVAFSFRLKLLFAVCLVAVADLFFWSDTVGWTLGGFALLASGAAAIAAPALWRNRMGAACLGFAILMGLVLCDQPGVLPLLLWWTALTVAVLSPRLARVDGIETWISRLAWHGVLSLGGPLIDLHKLKVHSPSGRIQVLRLLPLLALPAVGGSLFLILFSAANPLIARALASLRLPEPDPQWLLRGLLWLVTFWAAWSLLRPHWLKPRSRPSDRRPLDLPSLPSATLVLSLATFNALFAVENGLDLVFLWSGARLPDGMTLADYAHRGAYPLIATALLAGAFVLLALKPGSATARMPLVRWLLAAWVAQNIFLVASSMLRTIDYIQAYNLTRMRIAALLWMGLVALGLVLILWRMLAGRSGRWLVWSNAAAVLAVLAMVSVVDTGQLAADWNVRHAREAGGQGAELDFDYLRRLGPSALPALAWLERFAPAPSLRAQAAGQRFWLQRSMRAEQADWRGWTWRNARRLAAAGPMPPDPYVTPSRTAVSTASKGL